MRKKWGIICTILLICIFSLYSSWKKPEIVNCITTMDTTYISVLWRGNRVLNKEHAVREIIEMCRKNEFEDIKLSEHLEETVEDYYITIYKNEQQLQAGKVWLVVKYNRKENIMKIL